MESQQQKFHLQWRRTKIIATVAPASDSEIMIKKLILSGVDVFRLNMSHGDHACHKKTFRLIRKVSAGMERHIPILMDLCGPKIRVGEFQSSQITLTEGSNITVTCRNVMGDANTIPSQYQNLYKDVKPSQRILMDDGKLELRVEKIKDRKIKCSVIHGGVLKDHKGVNLPDTNTLIRKQAHNG